MMTLQTGAIIHASMRTPKWRDGNEAKTDPAQNPNKFNPLPKKAKVPKLYQCCLNLSRIRGMYKVPQVYPGIP